MNMRWLAVAAIVGVLGLLFFTGLPKKDKVCFGEECLEVEVMRTYEQRMRGLMFRDGLDYGKGMLFIFEEPLEVNFWMMNVRFPIDIIFIDENLRVANIAQDAQPCSAEPCARYPSEGKILYVVETAANYSFDKGIEPGHLVSLDLPV